MRTRPRWLRRRFASPFRGGGGRKGRGPSVLALLLALVPAAHAQDLVTRYRDAALRRQAERIVEEHGAKRDVLPPVQPALSDSALDAGLRRLTFQDLPLVVEPLPERFVLTSIRKVSRLERLSFGARFRDVAWSYAGSVYRTPLDTSVTWRLRGALEAAYGAPTQTIGDLGADVALGSGSAFEFEYWFVVNDAIPVRITDTAGPRDRGLIVATDARYRGVLEGLRAVVFGPLASGRPAPFADYFYDAAARQWYLAGYDGLRFVIRPIPRPDFRAGGRPSPDALRRDAPTR